MEKSSLELANYLELSTSIICVMLCRAEFNKYKHGTKYKINVGFIDDAYNFLELKKLAKVNTREKFQKAQKKLYQWKRRLIAQNAVF